MKYYFHYKMTMSFHIINNYSLCNETNNIIILYNIRRRKWQGVFVRRQSLA